MKRHRPRRPRCSPSNAECSAAPRSLRGMTTQASRSGALQVHFFLWYFITEYSSYFIININYIYSSRSVAAALRLRLAALLRASAHARAPHAPPRERGRSGGCVTAPGLVHRCGFLLRRVLRGFARGAYCRAGRRRGCCRRWWWRRRCCRACCGSCSAVKKSR